LGLWGGGKDRPARSGGSFQVRWSPAKKSARCFLSKRPSGKDRPTREKRWGKGEWERKHERWEKERAYESSGGNWIIAWVRMGKAVTGGGKSETGEERGGNKLGGHCH